MKLFLITTAVTASPIKPRIIGGEAVLAHSEPHIVSLQKTRSHFCGGSILSSTWLITAAHCHQISYDHVDAVVGAHNIHDKEEENQRVPILKLIRHANYDYNGLINDVAVAKTAKFMTINETVMPIQLPTQANAHWLDGSTGTNVRVCGWGKVQVRPAVYPDLLHCVEVPLVDSVTCNSAQHYNGAIFDGMFCAGVLNIGEKDACQGDSGGPIRSGDVLLGLVSWGYSCASPHYPGVYTDVAFYSDWVTTTIDDYNKI